MSFKAVLSLPSKKEEEEEKKKKSRPRTETGQFRDSWGLRVHVASRPAALTSGQVFVGHCRQRLQRPSSGPLEGVTGHGPP